MTDAIAGGAHAALRAATRDAHARLDLLMTRFDLADATRYAAFLSAHARALPAVETALDAAGFAARLADWPARRRGAALADDLRALGAPPPAPLDAPALASPAAQWGAAYVIEGSRLGGVMLARRVGAGLPRAYLATPPPPGNWRLFLAELDKAVMLPHDTAAAGAAANAVFGLFEQAARTGMETA